MSSTTRGRSIGKAASKPKGNPGAGAGGRQKPVSGARSTNGDEPPKERRSRAEIERISRAIIETASMYRPMTIRQLFYQLVSQGVIDKTEREYKGTVGRLATLLRKNGRLPYGWITDNTRFMRKPPSWAGIDAILDTCVQSYRRQIWAEHEVYVEIWLEKDALSGVLLPVTNKWDVPLMVTRGYPSLSFLYEAGETIKRVGRPTHLYYFGDLDPSGKDIPRNVLAGLREYASGVDINFVLVAVNPDQIEEYGLPTRPTKKTDSRAKAFGEERSVEVDAISPHELRRLCESCIVGHIDAEKYRRIKSVEESEKETMREIARNFRMYGA